MIKIENHPEYMDLQLALLALRLTNLENEQVIAEKQRLVKTILLAPNPVLDFKLAELHNLREQNQAVSLSFEEYFEETQLILSSTGESINYVRNGNFPKDVRIYEVRNELISMRLKLGVTSTQNALDIFSCKGKWYVAESDSSEALGEFDTLEEAQAYAKGLRRNGRIARILSNL